MAKTTGVVGPAGTASHEAAMQIGAKNIKFFRDIAHVFSALEMGEVEQAIVPIENVIAGSIGQTIDQLHDISPTIKAEIIIPIKLAIACDPKSDKDKIKYIISDQRAIAQSLGYLNKKFPKPELRNIASAARAMQLIAEKKLTDCAAIGSEFAATQYKLKVLGSDIEDRKGNATRYILIDMDGANKPTGDDKTAIFIIPKAQKDRPGILWEILGCFATRKINLTTMIVRPSIGKFWVYNFYFEMQGHQEDEIVKEALAELKKYADYKLLGSFKRIEFQKGF
jgi:prephenate dehydratase